MEYPATAATVETLPNGLTLILDPDPTAPVVSTQIWVATGSMHEGKHLGAGISHFLEHMVFKGTRDYDADTLADTVQAAGGHWNAYTSFDRTVYYIDGPSDSLPTFVKTLVNLVFFPNLPESEFEKEKDVIRREIDMGLDDPDNAASRLLFSTVFTLDPRRHPVIGHRHLFDAIRYDDLTAYHRERYTPDRCFAVVSGDFDAAEARKMIEELTAPCLTGCGLEPLVSKDAPQIGPRRGRDTFAIPTSRISLAWKTPALDHPDAPAYDVLAGILGRGRASRLHRSLREEQELALEISAFSWTGPGREGLLAISADAETAKRDGLIEAALHEVASVAASDLDDDLAKAKRQIAASQFRSLTTASGRASDLASNWHEARDLDFTRRYLAAIQAVTADDIRRVAATLSDERLSLTVLDPLEAEAPARVAKTGRVREEIQVHTLPNGLTLALIPDRRVPLVHLQAAVRGGLPSETPGTNGLNQLLASTLPKGTRTRSAQEIAVTLESLGASISANTGNNALLIQAAGLAPDFATIADVFAEVIISPSLSNDAIHREKASQLASLEEALQDPLHTGFSSLREAVFNGSGYGLDALGSVESLTALDQAALKEHHSRLFNASNIAISVAGDFEPASTLALLTDLFSTLPAGDAWTPPASHLGTAGNSTRHLPKKQAVITIGYPGTTVSGTDRFALAMIQEYASDMAGPLFTRIREELGLAYQVGGTQFLGYDTGLFTYYLATAPDQAELARRELLAEIAKIAAHGIPEETFDRVRSTVLSGLAIQQQSPAAVARHVVLDLLFGHPADQHRLLPAAYNALTCAQVREVAIRIFSVDATVVTVLPEE
ncbi:insulinase family protein [Luteolibacter yonseiensis]|uniref:Insulinase family protein n=1 Tax=Luteolibacter yonseiensis TaxID=1144680 RepID=A0A934VA28_9BACT|nr:pitrilysin family protein [Luteolibacter yonseiensis]MBK1814730.1 insulinase family protein [Luteolibacter yonseiensis]